MAETGTATRVNGQICWLEIPVADASRAAGFYARVLGWDTNVAPAMPAPANSGGSVVHMFKKTGGAGQGLNGAFLVVSPSVLTLTKAEAEKKVAIMAPLTSFVVESVEDTLAKVESEGGKVHVPKSAIGPDMGFFARFIDCEGNILGLWSQN